ncbi:MAG: class I SAM-dependent methyltransferase [Dehalococcoidia bacterium]|jgi:threonine dehydrogenase-like Zn-dependent dehydrogenase|nr:class I SAM-dependent methyltransferase [Dehalococcoidia bacterium]
MRHIDREATILELAAGKRVLHLGCVGHDFAEETDPVRRYARSLHAKIEGVASEVVGVDMNAEALAQYEQAGVAAKMIVGNVEQLETLELGDAFDVIVSGNVIEHLSHPGMMVDGMRALSHPGTTVLVTTPHAFGLPQYVRYVRGRFQESDDHMMTFNGPSLANLVERHGFRVVSIDTSNPYGPPKGLKRRLKFRLVRAFLGRFPHLGRTLVVHAELP